MWGLCGLLGRKQALTGQKLWAAHPLLISQEPPPTPVGIARSRISDCLFVCTNVHRWVGCGGGEGEVKEGPVPLFLTRFQKKKKSHKLHITLSLSLSIYIYIYIYIYIIHVHANCFNVNFAFWFWENWYVMCFLKSKF